MKLRSVGPLLMAFIVGLTVGGAGWNEWLARRDASAARSTVSFSARVFSADAITDGITANVQLTNTGPEVVRLDDVAIYGSEVLSSSRARDDTIEVSPGDEVTSRVLLRIDCESLDAVEPGVSIRVRTVDGVARSAELPLDDDSDSLGEAAMLLCPDPNDGFLPLAVESSGSSMTVDDGGPALRTPVNVWSWAPIDITVLTVRTLSRKLSVSVPGLPIELTGDERSPHARLDVTWRVDDCQDAGELRYEALGLVLEAQRPGGIVITTRVESDPNLALDVAKFVDDTCGPG